MSPAAKEKAARHPLAAELREALAAVRAGPSGLRAAALGEAVVSAAALGVTP
ncbi:hypothetical protein [uncultured Oscillibacter sp.]|uniref:hypothetical protein n=1 Tax=uncultured Oscillibacter sp. TaxID=876091 RepID=UPI00262B54F5|nr:hypothetical protein [uncultured Oscillibacter sp.]